MNLRIRPAEISDAQAVWAINRQPSVRRAAFCSDEIPWDSHLSWYQGVLDHPDRDLFVAYIGERDHVVAVIRFDLVTHQTSEITIAVHEALRGRGVGVKAITEASRLHLSLRESMKSITAYIKTENIASTKVFQKAGYTFEDTRIERDFAVSKYTKQRESSRRECCSEKALGSHRDLETDK